MTESIIYSYETDDDLFEYARCTCLDRGAIALEETGQHHCAMVLRDLQAAFDEVDKVLRLNPARPVQAVYEMLDAIMTIKVFDDEGGDND